jgi:predicted extracellular nuclease
MNWKYVGGLAAALMFTANSATAGPMMRITEWMYAPTGTLGEFVEFTNVSTSSIDMTGWSFDDDSRTPGSQDLSAYGTVAPGESVILTDQPASDFRTAWGLSASIKVIGDNTNNLGRNDEINLYDGTNALVDRLTYGDQTFAGTIRTQTKSGNPISLAALGANNPAQWVLSSNGDAYGSYVAGGMNAGDLGNPGVFTLYQVPEPTSLGLLAIAALIGRVRRRS